jgi:polysaccharide biosynthesis transport protein
MDNLTPVPFQNHSAPEPASGPVGGAAGADPKIRMQKFLTALRKFWWVPLLTLITSVGLAVILIFYFPPKFISYALLWETENMKLPDGASYTEDPETYFGTLKEVLGTSTMQNNAFEIVRLSSAQVPTTGMDGKPLEVKIDVAQAPKSSVFIVEAESSNPDFTTAYLNALVSAYQEYKRTVRKEVSGDTLNSIDIQVKRLESDLQAGQGALDEFEKSNNYAVLQQENEIAGSYLARLKTQLGDYQLESRLLDAVALEKDANLPGAANPAGSLFDSLNDSSGTSTTSTSPVQANGSQNPYQDIELLTLQRDRLSKYLRPEHPKIVKLNEDIARCQSLIDLYHKQNEEQIGKAREALQIRMTNEEQSITDWDAKVAYANSRIAEFERLQGNVTRKEATYERLMSLLQNVDITRNIDQETLTVLEPASDAKRSYKVAIISLALAIMVGLATGSGIVFLVSSRDDRLVSLVEVCERIGDNVVGQVPDVRQLKSGAPLGILERNDDRYMYIESFRSLRSALLYLTNGNERPKMLLITSAMPGEGKSTIATNLARILAMGGARVLLVDGDLRKGHLHNLLGLQAKPGLCDLLLGTSEVESLLQPTSLPGLSFVAHGANLRNSGDLFLSPVFDQFLAKMRVQFDHVIIDSSPVFATDDASTIAPKMDGTLLIVRTNYSRTAMVREALELLFRRQATILGLIINRANSSDRSYHYHKYANYYPVGAAESKTAGKG